MNVALSRSLLFIATTVVAASVEAAENERQREQALTFNCYACHSASVGRSAIPDLRGKPADELLGRLIAYKQDAGDATVMNRIAKGYSDEELALIAAYLAAQSRPRANRSGH